MDFRDHHIEKALSEAVGPYRPEKLRTRVIRIAIIAALTLVACVAFWLMLHYSSPKHGKSASGSKPVPVELLPAPAKR